MLPRNPANQRTKHADKILWFGQSTATKSPEATDLAQKSARPTSHFTPHYGARSRICPEPTICLRHQGMADEVTTRKQSQAVRLKLATNKNSKGFGTPVEL